MIPCRWKIIPRCLRGINCLNVDTSLTILGERIATPVCASPTGLHKIGNQNGELATIRGKHCVKESQLLEGGL